MCRSSGVFYPLSGATLTRGWSYAVSNEITADHADISLDKPGSCWLLRAAINNSGAFGIFYSKPVFQAYKACFASKVALGFERI